MNFSLLFGLCVINLIHGKYLLVGVDDTQNNPIEPKGNRCKYPPCIWWPKSHPQLEPNVNLCRHPPCRPSAPMKDSTCIPLGGKCESARQCCVGTCEGGGCIIGVRRSEGKNISVLRKQNKIFSYQYFRNMIRFPFYVYFLGIRKN